jgi:hypothetical protein
MNSYGHQIAARSRNAICLVDFTAQISDALFIASVEPPPPIHTFSAQRAAHGAKIRIEPADDSCLPSAALISTADVTEYFPWLCRPISNRRTRGDIPSIQQSVVPKENKGTT